MSFFKNFTKQKQQPQPQVKIKTTRECRFDIPRLGMDPYFNHSKRDDVEDKSALGLLAHAKSELNAFRRKFVEATSSVEGVRKFGLLKQVEQGTSTEEQANNLRPKKY